MRFIGLCVGSDGTVTCTTGGNQDRSLAASAVIVAGVLNVVKVVNTIGGGTSAITAFPFTASGNFGSTSFSLIDDDAGPGIDSAVSAGISAFGPGNEITVNEENTFGWSLADLTCTNNGLASATTSILVQPAAHAGTAVVTMNEGGIATCTFTNSQLQITAAPASITGRVTDPTGAGLRGVTVTLADVTSGQVRSATTNNFGYYTFNDLTVEDFYRMTVSSRRYLFRSQVRAFTLTTDLANMDFVSVE